MIRGMIQNVSKIAQDLRDKESSALMENPSNRAVVNAEMTQGEAV